MLLMTKYDTGVLPCIYQPIMLIPPDHDMHAKHPLDDD